MTETMKSAEDMVAEADTGARQAGSFATKLIFALYIIWSLFQLYIASKLQGVMAQTTGASIFANIVAQARFVHLAFALTLATLAFPILGHKNKGLERVYNLADLLEQKRHWLQKWEEQVFDGR